MVPDALKCCGGPLEEVWSLRTNEPRLEGHLCIKCMTWYPAAFHGILGSPSAVDYVDVCSLAVGVDDA